ncbi:MAG: glycine cleavage system protein GcvH [Candidatus Geothermarchaeales archaeon]
MGIKDSEVRKGYLYTEEHEWVRVEDDEVTVGVTDYAQQMLTDVVYAELPDVGKELSKDQSFMVLESVKSVSDVSAPITGMVSEVNEDLADFPERVNESPYDEGWLVKVRPSESSELEELMSADEYREFLAGEG